MKFSKGLGGRRRAWTGVSGGCGAEEERRATEERKRGAGEPANLAQPYPAVAADLTAGEWNRAAVANNRIEIRER